MEDKFPPTGVIIHDNTPIKLNFCITRERATELLDVLECELKKDIKQLRITIAGEANA